MIPFQISFTDFAESEAISSAVERRIEKLERYHNHIIRCEVVISCPHRHGHADRFYHVKIHVSIPGDDVIVSREPEQNDAHRDVYLCIRDVFDTAERLLHEKARIIRHEVKNHRAAREVKL